MLAFTGRLIVFLSLLTWRILESVVHLTLRLIIVSLNSAWKNLSLLMSDFLSGLLHRQTDLSIK
ncbi:hypothetical protein VB834_21835 [Limnoraphis robusta Tam1]|uniref:Uncharacterized protein n=1 Tax=Limnoraphis robusta CCNP1315 TaxID=3110306 RepID=A0ABU5U713_9CYAN|nr:hypothetical protein [Limnoraphis robusta]MEA5496650.1 hypothetical protein [Limnoraphis robusta BA-68 BA1]MEA5522949.1 hypothetical protein [Limnoraphis robusta CCNP1315]MEA5541673.1 hypothetical protein [Limnoraphis robusta Tam1]MEA5548657.1 hypothetical protein [Limnoraphis robusta CCNP1324]